MSEFHHELEPQDIHAPYSFVFDSLYSLENSDLVYKSEDIGKLAYITIDSSIWQLRSSKPEWIRILDETCKTTPIGVAGGHLKGLFPNAEVVNDSHNHTPGVSIPKYPESLPPIGNAGGDFTGTFPNPLLKDIGVKPGTYHNPSIEVDSKGRITKIINESNLFSNTIINSGIGSQILNKSEITTINQVIKVRSLKSDSPNLLISENINEINFDIEGILLSSNPNFIGTIKGDKAEIPSINSIINLTYKVFDSGNGSSWNINANDGQFQIRKITNSGYISSIVNSLPGQKYKLILEIDSIGNYDITFSNEYKLNQPISLEKNSINELNVTILKEDLYLVNVTVYN